MDYRLLIDHEVIEFLETLPRRERHFLRDRLVDIRDQPQKFSDYTEPDSTSRRVDIHICDRYAVKFWQDHPDRHIKILDLHFADRAPRIA